MAFNNTYRTTMACALCFIIGLSACAKTQPQEEPTVIEETVPAVAINKVYSPKTYEDGYTYNLKTEDNREFSIELKSNGKYSFTELTTSSTVGVGVWTQDDDVVTLAQTEGYPILNKFKVDKETLTFVKKGSSNFPFEILQDGDIYTITSIFDEYGNPKK